ncbi:MAG: glycosyltransferase family 4 protein [Candidatus Nitrosocosmicus sp.]|nr:glycosyltransferase family 4 protein [Candidatus Nitrosocosmicus sp.]MDN5866670.1 glycosyltransferase family 4 protein [Candidatus Nitrosocosmicus sp.]
MKKTIVLFSDGTLLPSGEGATFRDLELVKGLMRKGYEITFIHAFRGWSNLDMLTKSKFQVILVNPHDYYNGTKVISSILNMLSPDAIVMKNPTEVCSAVYNKILPIKTKIIFDCHDLNNKNYREKPLDRAIDLIAAELSDAVFCITKDIKSELSKFVGKKKKLFFVPATISSNLIQPKRHVGRGHVLGFLGNFYHNPNYEALEWICNKLLPIIKSYNKNIRIHVIGDCPRSLFKKIKSSNVVCFGQVDNPIPYLHECDIALSPMFKGSGFRTKLLYYIASGLPTVATKLGLEGIGRRKCFQFADNEYEMANMCLDLLNSADLRNEKSKDSIRILKRGFLSDNITKHFDCVWNIELESESRSIGNSALKYLNQLIKSKYLSENDIEIEHIARRTPLWLNEIIMNKRFKYNNTNFINMGEWIDLSDPKSKKVLDYNDYVIMK